MWIEQVIQDKFVQILLTAIITSLLTYWLTRKQEWRLRSIENQSKLIKDVYAPIMKIIYGGIWPFDGYEGLSENQIDNIIKIVDDNEMIIEIGLHNHAWSMKEEQYINNINQIERATYDIDRNFLEYVEQQYHKLRKSVGLPFDKRYIGIRRRLRKIYEGFRKSKIFCRYRKWKYNKKVSKKNDKERL